MGTILIVDDVPDNLALLANVLQPHYRVRAANCGRRALAVAKTEPVPDLILLDITMPDLDGFAVLQQLKADDATADIPVIFVTALGASSDEELGLNLGAVDYITKPINAAVVLARVRAQLQLKAARDVLREDKTRLESDLARRRQENIAIQDSTILALAQLAELRDSETGQHLRRTQAYLRILCTRLRHHPRYADFLTESNIRMLIKSAPLHDIGKVGIPDAILLKAGPLTTQEWTVMKTHSRLGADAIRRAEQDAGRPVPFLRMAGQIALHHHEWWDGTGYPDGLSGEDIPIPARLMTLADVFDALTTPRPYKRALPPHDAAVLIRRRSGLQFDPAIVDAFDSAFDEFATLAGTRVPAEALAV